MLVLKLRKDVLITVLIFLFATVATTEGQSQKDPHRPVCIDSQCRAVRTFVRTRYCRESPYGNGPDNGCDIRLPKHPLPETSVIASYDCKWSDSAEKAICRQTGNLPPDT